MRTKHRSALAALLSFVTVLSTLAMPDASLGHVADQSTAAPAAVCTPAVGPGIPPPVSVPAGMPGFHASWYGQSGYQSLCPGDVASAVVAYYNSGSFGWVRGRMGESAYLGTWGPEPGQDQPTPLGGDGTHGSPATGWPQYNRVAVQPADYVGPGQIAWFQFSFRAPMTPGTYRLFLRPVVEGATWMEDYGVFWVFTVLPGTPPSHQIVPGATPTPAPSSPGATAAPTSTAVSTLPPGGTPTAPPAASATPAPTVAATPTPTPIVVPTPTSTPVAGGGSLIPADRLTTWSPGIPGGIPSRTTVCATVSASTYGSGTTDASGGIQAALDACPVGQVVQLSAGTFKIARALEINKGVVLRGAGPSQTKLNMPVGTNDHVIVAGTQWFSFTQSTNLSADAVKGQTSVTLASVPSGLAPGEIVLVDELTDPAVSIWSTSSPLGDASRGWFTRTNRPVGQVMEVAGVSGNTVTFTTPFHITMKRSYTAQLTRFSSYQGGPVAPAVRYAGIEDLYVRGGSGGQGNILLSNTAYSWVRNVESDFQAGASVALEATFRSVVRDSYIHSTQTPEPGGNGYGLSFAFYAADNLVENNIVWNQNKVMVMRASGGGNVIGYNYMEDGWIDYYPGWVETGLNASHMTTPHYELFEGNESFNFDGDNTWGNSVYITVLRNHLTGKRRNISGLGVSDVDNTRAIGLMAGHMYYTFVGNVLGTAGQDPSPHTSYEYDARFPWTDQPVPMWRLGYDPENWGAAPDTRVTGTAIREGNYDYVTGQVHWSAGAQTIPVSLYLSSRPAFFGSDPWPWVDPTSAQKTYVLPARARFDAMPSH